MSIKLKQLSHILALEEFGSFSRAAASLHISQPALSRSIQSMEADVGAPLFLREGQRVVPTDLGRVVVEHARQITRLADDLHDRLVGGAGAATRELSIGAGPFPGETIVGRAVAALIQSEPMLKVRVDIRNWDELLPRLRNQDIDLFVAETSTFEQDSDLEVELLSQRQLYFFARRGHPLAGAAPTVLAEILGYPIATAARIPPRMLDPALWAVPRSRDRRKVEVAFPALQCGNSMLLKQVALASDTIIVSSLACTAQELESGELVKLGGEPWMRQNYGLVSLKGKLPNGDLRRLRDCLLEAERAVAEEEAVLAEKF